MASELTKPREGKGVVKLTWLGHAMFLLEVGDGRRLVTDPFDAQVGYPVPEVSADIVLVSHDHFDHNNVSAIKGNPRVIKEPGETEVSGIVIRGFLSHHDPKGGSERGPNIVYRFTMGGMDFVHVGDLGHLPDQGLAEKISGADVLLVPVGGTFTIDDQEAEQLVRMIKPRLVIPMHFRNDACAFPIKTVEPFLQRFDRVERAGKGPLYLSREALPDTMTVVLLDYASG